MYDVYFYEAFDEEQNMLKKYLPANLKGGFCWETIQEKGDTLPPAPIISTRSQSIIPKDWADKLKAILSRSTGYDHLKKYEETTSKKIDLGYLPLYCNRAVAEQAMLLWMSLLRKLPVQMKQFENFERSGISGIECQGKLLVVVGVGNIGSEIVKVGQGLGMIVRGVDIVERYPFLSYRDINEVLPEADILVCAMNLTKDNINYFNYEKLKKAKKGVIFINIARGEMSSSGDLLKLVKQNHIGGLGLDVYNEESELAVTLRSGTEIKNAEVLATLKLKEFSNVIFTPHNAFNTIEAVDRKAKQSIEQIEYYLDQSRFKWPIPSNNII
jgi:D-lactate dehydrogenase